jgi:HK97 family phage prohead protease
VSPIPWEIRKGFGRCGPDKWAVVKQGTDEVLGCHTSEASAKRQQAALYANEPAARADGAELLAARPVSRTFELEDMTIRTEGSGRVVESYFAVFAPIRSEVMDQDGHYLEENHPSLFKKTLAERGLNIPVFYNHARTLDGTPDGSLSVPVGKPIEIKADSRGVFNAVRYLDNPLADSILDGIRHKVINGMSYSGRYLKSTKSYPQGRGRGRLPLIVRHEAALREFGPTAIPQFPEAEILGARAQQFMRMLLAGTANPADLEAEYEGLTTPPEGEPEDPTPDTPEVGAVETEEPQPQRQHSARSMSLATRIRVARITRGME